MNRETQPGHNRRRSLPGKVITSGLATMLAISGMSGQAEGGHDPAISHISTTLDIVSLMPAERLNPPETIKPVIAPKNEIISPQFIQELIASNLTIGFPGATQFASAHAVWGVTKSGEHRIVGGATAWHILSEPEPSSSYSKPMQVYQGEHQGQNRIGESTDMLVSKEDDIIIFSILPNEFPVSSVVELYADSLIDPSEIPVGTPVLIAGTPKSDSVMHIQQGIALGMSRLSVDYSSGTAEKDFFGIATVPDPSGMTNLLGESGCQVKAFKDGKLRTLGTLETGEVTTSPDNITAFDNVVYYPRYPDITVTATYDINAPILLSASVGRPVANNMTRIWFD